jgi:hypothetical protein
MKYYLFDTDETYHQYCGKNNSWSGMFSEVIPFDSYEDAKKCYDDETWMEFEDIIIISEHELVARML